MHCHLSVAHTCAFVIIGWKFGFTLLLTCLPPPPPQALMGWGLVTSHRFFLDLWVPPQILSDIYVTPYTLMGGWIQKWMNTEHSQRWVCDDAPLSKMLLAIGWTVRMSQRKALNPLAQSRCTLTARTSCDRWARGIDSLHRSISKELSGTDDSSFIVSSSRADHTCTCVSFEPQVRRVPV